MNSHVFKRGNRQEVCQWCGKACMACSPFEECPADAELRLAVKSFAEKHGRTWKAKLRHIWTVNGREDEGALRRARNIVGPRGLDRISEKVLSLVKLLAVSVIREDGKP